jgi:hypothetical protein
MASNEKEIRGRLIRDIPTDELLELHEQIDNELGEFEGVAMSEPKTRNLIDELETIETELGNRR